LNDGGVQGHRGALTSRKEKDRAQAGTPQRSGDPGLTAGGRFYKKEEEKLGSLMESLGTVWPGDTDGTTSENMLG